ncbi:MAG TPA: hypothetical protein VNF99_08380 [Stellaceae bacterium]|nr:hypothetical protein [Stellaceae bacterium]
MTGKHLARGLAAIAFLAFAVTKQANAAILELDCSLNGQFFENIWVDFDKSVVTESVPGHPLVTYPALITATSISWKLISGPVTDTYNIDRTTGDYHTGVIAPGAYGPGGHGQCVKGTKPFPATKF